MTAAKLARAVGAENPLPPSFSSRSFIGTTPEVKPFHHRDYRIVFDDAMNCSPLRSGNSQSRDLWTKHRCTFEGLIYEDPFAAMMRALGLMETKHFERFGTPISEDYVIGKSWLQMWFETRRCLSHTGGEMLDAGLCDAMLVALGLNAGFSEKELQ